MTEQDRPLSPHLQVYKPQMTSVLSITHRATGAALAIGLLYVAWMLVATYMGEDAYNVFFNFSSSIIGKIMLFGWTVCIYYHLSNGIRHLFWDTGRLFKIKHAERAGYAVIASTIILTAGTWICACMFS